MEHSALCSNMSDIVTDSVNGMEKVVLTDPEVRSSVSSCADRGIHMCPTTAVTVRETGSCITMKCGAIRVDQQRFICMGPT